MKPTIIYAPPGAGKSLHAEALRKQYGCDKIVDDWYGGEMEDGTLYLTNVMVDGAVVWGGEDKSGED
jgi:hypothetical protein